MSYCYGQQFRCLENGSGYKLPQEKSCLCARGFKHADSRQVYMLKNARNAPLTEDFGLWAPAKVSRACRVAHAVSPRFFSTGNIEFRAEFRRNMLVNTGRVV
jgi:hypothetical protein